MPCYPLGLFDPFSVDARSTGIPDPDINECVRYNYTDVFQLNTDAHGVAAGLFFVDPMVLFMNATVGTLATNWAWNTVSTLLSGVGGNIINGNTGALTESTLHTALRQEYAAWRMVNGGIKIASTLGATAQGMVSVVSIPFDVQRGTYGNWENNSLPVNISDVANQKTLLRSPCASLVADSIVSVFKPLSPNAYDYRTLFNPWFQGSAVAAPTTDIAPTALFGVNAILVVVTGGPASVNGVLDIEMTINYEFLIAATAGGGGGATFTRVQAGNVKAEPSRPMVMAATECLLPELPDSRVVDDSGVAEEGFIDKLEQGWGSAVKAATTVAEVGSVLAKIGAMVL